MGEPPSSLHMAVSSSVASENPEDNTGEAPSIAVNDLEKQISLQEEKEEKRETWSQSLDFLFSIIGFAVDLANVWRFPFFCLRHGGGAFLLPYFICLFLSAMPTLYMELLLGQAIRQGPISLWKICLLFKGIGYCAVTVSYFVSFYYNTIMAWSFHYAVNSFKSPLPWTMCNNEWNTRNCTIAGKHKIWRTDSVTPAAEYWQYKVLGMQGYGIDHIGPPKMDLFVCLVAVYFLLYFILFRGIRSTDEPATNGSLANPKFILLGFNKLSRFFVQIGQCACVGKVVWVTATLPYVVLLILLIKGLTLEGAYDGIIQYIKPDVTRLTDITVWSDAMKQIFYSSGAGFGVHLTFASYNDFHHNCYRDCLVTSFVNSMTSLFAGFVVFTFAGSIAHKQGLHVADLKDEQLIGPGLVFEVYPEAVGMLPGSNFWSLLFFIMLIMLGIDSAMGGIECIITGIMDEFKDWFRGKAHGRELLMFVLVLVSFLVSITNITRGGIHVFNFFDYYAAGSSLLFAVFFEVFVVSWVYGIDQLCMDAKAMLGYTPGIYWRICWKYISPLFLGSIIVLDFIFPLPLNVGEGDNNPKWAVIFGYVFTFIPVMFVPIIGIIEFFKLPGNCLRKLAYSISPTNEHKQIAETGYVKRFRWAHWLYTSCRCR